VEVYVIQNMSQSAVCRQKAFHVDLDNSVIAQSQDGTAFHLDSTWKRSSETCMKLTNAECTVENS